MIIDFLLFGLLFYLSIPFIAGYAAVSYGRSFWLWFGISCFLPVITHFVLYAVISFEHRKARLELGLDRLEEEKMKKLINQAMETPEKKIERQLKRIVQESNIRLP